MPAVTSIPARRTTPMHLRRTSAWPTTAGPGRGCGRAVSSKPNA